MVRVFCDYAFLEEFTKLQIEKNRSKVEFVEKYIFVQKLLRKHLHLNAKFNYVDKLNDALAKQGQLSSEDDPVFDYLVSLRKNVNNPIQPDLGIISKIRLLPDELDELKPFDIFLLKADKQFCQDVSKKYGVLCIGINHESEIHVNTALIQVNFEATNDLFNKFCSILHGTDEITSKAIVIDQHFFSNTVLYNEINTSLRNKQNEFLSIHFCENPRNSKPKNIKQITTEIESKSPELSDKITLSHINNFNYHDRYLIIGTKIFIAGNSFTIKDCKSYLNSLPFALYFDNLPENIRKIIELS